MGQLQNTMMRLWESACQDKPLRPSCQVGSDGQFIMTINGNQDQWGELCQAAGVPADAEQLIDDTYAGREQLVVCWPSHADAIFGADGLLASRLFEYEVRMPQLHMARLVQRSIEMGTVAAIEAGTGTGKSFAYAAVAMAMGKRLVISTSNKALQMQLYKKDLPFLQTIWPDKRIALAVGKSNYACNKKAEDGLSGTLTIDDPALSEWYTSTDTGNLEELEAAVPYEAVNAIRVGDDCDGKGCPLYAACHYHKARGERANADVVVTNHALLCLHQLYPTANILPSYDVLVVDEAHKLPDYARAALGTDTTDSALAKAAGDDLEAELLDWLRPLKQLVAEGDERASQLGISQDTVLDTKLAELLDKKADLIWRLEDAPETALERQEARKADKLRTAADHVRAMATYKPRHVRWLEPDRKADRLGIIHRPFDVAAFVAGLCGIEPDEVVSEAPPLDHTRCHRCGRQLTADMVAVLDGQPYGPDCIRHVDLFGDAERMALTDWLAAEHEPSHYQPTRYHLPSKPTILTSATLAAPDMSAFLRECGLPDAMQMVVPSPFDYEASSLLYTPGSEAPPPNSREYGQWVVEELQQLVLASQGGAFLLFTSYANMNRAAAALRWTFSSRGWDVLVQGELPKLELAKRFAAHGNAVLFATKSFFEGVSIEGDALRLVVIDKLPFEAPSPMTTAMAADLQRHAREQLGLNGRDAEFYPFNQLSVPRMIVDLKQGSGRLIRTRRDWGVMAILDSRVRGTRYGRDKVLPSLPPAPLARSMGHVEEFYTERLRQPAQAPAMQFLEAMAGGGA